MRKEDRTEAFISNWNVTTKMKLPNKSNVGKGGLSVHSKALQLLGLADRKTLYAR
jgi:hypothetical protein